jgi:uncharacterized membrane protein
MIRKWLFAGLMVWIPLGATLAVIRILLEMLDSSLLLIPASHRPDIPFVGAVLSIVLVFGTGMLVANYRGGQLLAWAEGLVARIPLVSSLYGGTKKLAESLFSGSSNAFRKVVLIEWPRKGIWAVGFMAGGTPFEVSQRLGIDALTVFVPTTPNPTAGFIMQVPREEVIVLDMSVEEGMSYIISLGVVQPGQLVAGSRQPVPAASTATSAAPADLKPA